MPVDDEELKALRRAVAGSPDDLDLRLRLISRFLAVGRPQDAWHHAIRLLNRDPRHVEALRLAHQAAVAAGSAGRAEEYAERLAELTAGPQPARGPLRLIRGGREDSGESHPPVRGD